MRESDIKGASEVGGSRGADEDLLRQRLEDLEHDRDGLSVRNRLLALICEISRLLLQSDEFERALNHCLAMIGKEAGLGGVLIIQPIGQKQRITHVWSAGDFKDYSRWEDNAPSLQSLRPGERFWSKIGESSLSSLQRLSALHSEVVGCVPLFVDGANVGVVLFDNSVSQRPWVSEQVEALEAFANVVSAALQGRRNQERQREREKAAAVAKERLAESSRSNQALRNVNAKLAAETHPRAGLRHIIAEGAKLTEADAVLVLRYESKSECMRVVCGYLDGEAGESLLDHPAGDPNKPVPVRELHFWPDLLGGSPRVVRPLEPGAIREISYKWHVRHGFHKIVRSALLVGSEPIGMIGVAYRRDQESTPLQFEAHANMAQQATLALRMMMLGEERAADLTEAFKQLEIATSGMRSTIAGLTGAATFEDVLADLLASAIRTVGAASGAVVLANEDAEHIVLIERGRRVSREVQEQEGTLRAPINAALRDQMQAMQHSESIWAPPPTDLAHGPAFLAYHQKVGIRSIRNVPFLVGGRLIGWLGLGFAEPEPPLGERVPLLRTLADQMTVAVELYRMAQEAEQATIAREQAKAALDRARELSKANDAMKRIAAKLSAAADLSIFLKELLLETCLQLGADAGHLTTYDPARRTLHTEALVQDGRVRQEEFPVDFFLEKENFFDLIVKRGCPVSFDFERDAHLFFPGTYEYHIEHGHTYTYAVPLLIEGRPLGHIGIATKSAERLVEEQLGFLETLAQQAALALELNRLSLEAKEQAILHEQEEAARSRASELIKANRALKESVRAVAQSSDFDQSLSEVVLRIADAARAQKGHLFIFDGKTNTLRSEFWFENGHAHRGDDPTAPEQLRGAFDADITPAFRMFLAKQEMVYLDLEKVDDSIRVIAWPGTIEWHLAQGRKAAGALPISAGEQPLGILGLSWTTEVSLTQEQLEVLSALSNHAALVMQLRQMERDARERAVANEKARATTEERNRIAREIHDTLAQGYVGILMQLQVLRDSQGSGDEAGRRALEQMDRLARKNLLEARRSIEALRPEGLEEKGLIETLREMLAGVERNGRTRTELITTVRTLNLPSQVEDEIQRIVQEALHNILKHADADSVTLTVDSAGVCGVRISIYDNGRGFSPLAEQRSASFGIHNMRERASRIGASLTIASEPGAGCELILLWLE